MPFKKTQVLEKYQFLKLKLHVHCGGKNHFEISLIQSYLWQRKSYYIINYYALKHLITKLSISGCIYIYTRKLFNGIIFCRSFKLSIVFQFTTSSFSKVSVWILCFVLSQFFGIAWNFSAMFSKIFSNLSLINMGLGVFSFVILYKRLNRIGSIFGDIWWIYMKRFILLLKFLLLGFSSLIFSMFHFFLLFVQRVIVSFVPLEVIKRGALHYATSNELVRKRKLCGRNSVLENRKPWQFGLCPICDKRKLSNPLHMEPAWLNNQRVWKLTPAQTRKLNKSVPEVVDLVD